MNSKSVRGKLNELTKNGKDARKLQEEHTALIWYTQFNTPHRQTCSPPWKNISTI